MKNSCWRSLVSVLIFVNSASILQSAETFVDDRFEDFAAGRFDDGGHNAYVARDGTIRTINRFDLNADGYLDLLFNCTHNTYQMLPATAGRVTTGRNASSSDIAVEGSQQVVVRDLNGDGYSDLVFCPNGIGVHHDRRFISIAWGGADGWSSSRINSPLPMNAAKAVAVADLNADGRLDIAVLGAPRWRPEQPEGQILRIYWGSPTGYAVTEFKDLGFPSAMTCTAADFDRDGFDDLAVLRSDGKLDFVWGEKPTKQSWSAVVSQLALPNVDATCLSAGDVNSDGRADLVIGSSAAALTIVIAKEKRNWQPPARIPAFPATQISIGDLDADERGDLVLTSFDQARAAGGEQAGAGKTAQDLIRVLWGSESGYDAGRLTKIEMPLASATAIGDLDGDGHADLAVAIHQGVTTFAGESVVMYGNGKRQFEKGQSGFRTSGTLHVAIAPAEKEFPPRAVFSNSIGGQLDEDVPLLLYWGGAGGFDRNRVWALPFHSGYEGSAADLNADGFPELIVLNSGHSGEHAHHDPTLGANILWGGPDGLEKSTQRTVLHEHFLGTSSVADLNRDGWLDLVLEPFAPEHGGEKEKLIIYYGGSDGFPTSRRKTLSLGGYAQEHLVADFNGDQWLDVAVTTREIDSVRILWGGADGFDVTREQRLKVAGPVGVDAADFNNDGRLDLVVGSYNDPVSGHRDMGLVIFWGADKGYDHSNGQWLPGFSPLGRTIADFDGDGHLDLFSPQHSGELTREDLACHLYWGSETGFATRRRTTLFCDSVNDSMAGDFNGDGRIDLAVNCHTRHGDHRTQSRVFYNDGARFENPRIQKLPTNGPHLIWAEDVGHILDRKYRQRFESRPFETRPKAAVGSLSAKATVSTGTRLEFEIRTATAKDQLATASWKPVTDGKYVKDAGQTWLQYRATLHSDNGDRYPTLDRVEISLE